MLPIQVLYMAVGEQLELVELVCGVRCVWCRAACWQLCIPLSAAEVGAALLCGVRKV
jgi:hypothetical protein